MMRFSIRAQGRSQVRFQILRSVALSSALLLGGCMIPPSDDAARIGPFFAPSNYTGGPQLPATLRRVVLLPIAGGTVAPAESVAALDPVFTAQLQRQNRFEIVTLTRAECLQRFQAEEFPSAGALPATLLNRLQREFGADGVMFIDLTVFKPYRPLAIGVRAKLATVEDPARLVWTFDDVYSAAEAPVANSARAHFLESDGGRIPADLTPSVLQSPGRFATYVASSVFSTLPPVFSAVPTNDAKPAPEVATPR